MTGRVESSSLRPVEELQALCDAATPGPWSFYQGDLWHGVTAEELNRADTLAREHAFSDEAEDIFERSGHIFLGDPERWEDAEFIAAARTALPSLLARLRAAEETLAAVGALAEEWRYKGEHGWGPWQLGEGPDQEGFLLDECSTLLRAALAEGASR